MAFLPADFEIPTLLETDRFRLRPIRVDDLDLDYEAVMSSREELWRRFGQAWGWPPEDLTLEQDGKDLRWHEEEFECRSSFDYAVMTPDERWVAGRWPFRRVAYPGREP
jgi:hypothetical protein